MLQQYAIAGGDGKTVTVSGVVTGFLGVHKHPHKGHKGVELYHVTHIPTGYCLHRFWLEEVAIACCKELSEILGDKLNFTLENKPQGALATQIKSIIDKHDQNDDDREDHL